MRCLVLALLVQSASFVRAEEAVSFPGTRPLTESRDLADVMMDGLHRFIEHKIDTSPERRTRYWHRDCSSPAAYERSIQPNRERLQEILGLVDPRVPVRNHFDAGERQGRQVRELEGHVQWEMPYFDLGSTFNYAEMAYLMVPRPFMVERGHQDVVAPDEWVAYEYAKVRRLYDQLGIGDRTRIEFFDGPHTIHGRGTFDFLHEQLHWPERR